MNSFRQKSRISSLPVITFHLHDFRAVRGLWPPMFPAPFLGRRQDAFLTKKMPRPDVSPAPTRFAGAPPCNALRFPARLPGMSPWMLCGSRPGFRVENEPLHGPRPPAAIRLSMPPRFSVSPRTGFLRSWASASLSLALYLAFSTSRDF